MTHSETDRQSSMNTWKWPAPSTRTGNRTGERRFDAGGEMPLGSLVRKRRRVNERHVVGGWENSLGLDEFGLIETYFALGGRRGALSCWTMPRFCMSRKA